MTSYKLIAIDVDGTITESRSSSRICEEVIGVLRRVEGRGISVSLVSSNSLPVVVGLMKYIGLSGPVIGETGSLIYFRDGSIVHMTAKSTREALEAVLREFGKYVKESWQNSFRVHEFALNIRDEYRSDDWGVFRMVKEFVESSYSDVRVDYSKYAIHLVPRDVDKGRALKYAIERLNIPRSQVVGIGDSYMDLAYIRECGLGVAVSNADEELKESVDIVLERPSCYGVIEFLEKMLSEPS